MKMKKLKILKQINLNVSEKEQLYSRILKSIGESPQSSSQIKSPYIWSFFSVERAKIAAFSFVVFLLTSLTTYASFNSLPGDILYPIKTKVLEKVIDVVFLTNVGQAKRNSIKLESRIKEFEVLAEKGKLDEKRALSIEVESNKELKKFDDNLEKINDKKNIKEKLNKELEEKVEKHREQIIKIRDDEKFKDKKVLESVLNRAVNRVQNTVDKPDGDFGKNDSNSNKNSNNDKNKSSDRLDGNNEKGSQKNNKGIYMRGI